MSRRRGYTPPLDYDAPPRTHYDDGTPVGALRWATCPVCGFATGRYDATRVAIPSLAVSLSPDGDVRETYGFPWPHDRCVGIPDASASGALYRAIVRLTSLTVLQHVAEGHVRLESDAFSRWMAQHALAWARDNPGAART